MGKSNKIERGKMDGETRGGDLMEFCRVAVTGLRRLTNQERRILLRSRDRFIVKVRLHMAQIFSNFWFLSTISF